MPPPGHEREALLQEDQTYRALTNGWTSIANRHGGLAGNLGAFDTSAGRQAEFKL